MGKKTSNSLQKMAQSLGVEEGAYFNLRKAVLEHLDEKTGSRNATIALNSASIDRFLEAFVDQPVAKRYARILENLDSAHNEAYNKAIPVLRKLTYEWIRNLKKKKKHGGKNPCRQLAVTSPINESRPTTTSLEEEEDLLEILPDIEAILGSASRTEPDDLDFSLANIRDDTVRPDSPNFESTIDVAAARSPSPQSLPRNRHSSPSSPLRTENNDATHPGRSNAKRRYDQVLSDEQSFQDFEEQTDEEDEQLHEGPSSNRAGERVRRDGIENLTSEYSETAARTPALPTTHGSTRNTRLLSHQSSSTKDELKLWLNLFLLPISERRRYIMEDPEAGTLSADDLEFVLNTFDKLHADLREIVAKVSPRLA